MMDDLIVQKSASAAMNLRLVDMEAIVHTIDPEPTGYFFLHVILFPNFLHYKCNIIVWNCCNKNDI